MAVSCSLNKPVRHPPRACANSREISGRWSKISLLPMLKDMNFPRDLSKIDILKKYGNVTTKTVHGHSLQFSLVLVMSPFSEIISISIKLS